MRQGAGLTGMSQSALANVDTQLRALPVTAADKLARCARYDNDVPRFQLPAGKPRLLIFEKINGFKDTPSVDAAHAAFLAMAKRKGWAIVSTDKGGAITPAILKRFDAVIWNNISGDVLTLSQRRAFQDWIDRGGAFVGIHGSAGDFIYSWDWYADTLIGARFEGHPMAPQFQDAKVVANPDHVLARALPIEWMMNDEWYSFRTLAIRLAHFGQLYPRRLQSVSVASGLMSAGRASALLARMQDVGFIEVAACLQSGRVRPYRIKASMMRSFAALLAINLRSLAPTEYRAVLTLEAIKADEGETIPVLAAFAAAALDDLRSSEDGLTKHLNGVSSMARGQAVALAIAADAIERHGTAGEGWIGISLTDYAQRFDVSRAQLSWIIVRLEGCGLLRDPASPSRLLVTDRFMKAIESIRRASCNLLAGALARVI